MKRLVLFCAVAATSAGHAQNVIAVHMQGQPLVYTNEGKPTGCGVRVVGIIDPVAGWKEFRTFDISANVWATGVAMGKVIGEINVVGNRDPRQAKRQALHGAWFRSEGDDPVAPSGQSFAPSPTDKGAYLFQASSGAVADFLIAVVKAQPILVGLRWQKGIESIYSGPVLLQDDERRQIANCVSQVFK
jgi:hypothetical protein